MKQINLRSVTKNSSNPVADAELKHKQRINKLSNEEVIKELPLEFELNNVVELKPDKIGYATHYKELVGKQFTVEKAKMADLGDMAVEVLYFKESNDNPFLASHFVKI